MATEKKQVAVRNIAELTSIVEAAIKTGRTDMNLHMPADMLIDPKAWALLEKLQDEHPASQPQEHDDASHGSEETPSQAETKAPAEVVSYSTDATEPQVYCGVRYQVQRVSDGWACKILSSCGSAFEPWSCSFDSIDDADLHARAYIDTLAPKRS